MDECHVCPKSKHQRGERARHSPRRRRYRPMERKRRFSPPGCNPCSTEDVRISRKPFTLYNPCEPCPTPCRERCCFPSQTDSGLLHTIRSSILKIFNGRKTNQLYMYTISQLRSIEQLVDKLDEETCCIEGMIKQAVECECTIDCNELRCTLTTILNRVQGIKCDLTCARNCYDPCRDRCEFEFICSLMDRVCNLEKHLEEMCLHLGCLQVPAQCDPCCAPAHRVSCRPANRKCGCNSFNNPCLPAGCAKPCECTSCFKQGDTICRSKCFDKSKFCGPKNIMKLGTGNPCSSKGLHRTSSVIPVGVMLVKL